MNLMAVSEGEKARHEARLPPPLRPRRPLRDLGGAAVAALPVGLEQEHQGSGSAKSLRRHLRVRRYSRVRL